MTETQSPPVAHTAEDAAIRARVAELVAEAPPLTAEQRRAAVRAFANTSTTHLVATPQPETVRTPRRGRAAKADPFAVMQTDESRMADRIDEAFGDAS